MNTLALWLKLFSVVFSASFLSYALLVSKAQNTAIKVVIHGFVWLGLVIAYTIAIKSLVGEIQ